MFRAYYKISIKKIAYLEGFCCTYANDTIFLKEKSPKEESTSLNEKRVVIVGAGFAGLNAAKRLVKKSFKITLIDKTNHHLFQPLLYQVATAVLAPSDIIMPVREIFKKYPNVETLMATVVHINKEQKYLQLENDEQITFDYLILAPGAHHAYFGNEHWQSFAPGLKTLQDGLILREKIFASFEWAERASSVDEQKRLMTFAIIGGGPTGVEMAGAIAEIAYLSLKNNYRHINPAQSQIYLIEGANQLLVGYPSRLAQRAKKDLESMGVTVKLNALVSDVNAKGVVYNNELLETTNIIWAAGNKASSLLETLNVPLDKQGRVKVESDLSVPYHPDIFVIGDAAYYQEQGKVLPAIAPVAVQQGIFVGDLIKKSATGKKHSFHYVNWGMMATIGKYKALVLSGPIQCGGLLGWFAWCFVHIYSLIDFRAKIFVFIQWLFYLIKEKRNARIVLNAKCKE